MLIFDILDLHRVKAVFIGTPWNVPQTVLMSWIMHVTTAYKKTCLAVKTAMGAAFMCRQSQKHRNRSAVRYEVSLLGVGIH